MVAEEAADPDANIIFGAVVDDSLGDEMRVTVVATCLGEEVHPAVVSEDVEIAPVRLVGREAAEQEELDYNSLEVPTNIRRNPKPAAGYGGQAKETDDMEYLDIPAFLRRQAD